MMGIIIGLLIAILLFVIEIYLNSKKGIISFLAKPIASKLKPKGSIIMPIEEIEKDRQAIIDENNKKGIDTKLEDLM